MTTREEVINDAETQRLVRRYMAKERAKREAAQHQASAEASENDGGVEVGRGPASERCEPQSAVEYVCLTCAHRMTVWPNVTDRLRYCPGCGGEVRALL